MNTRRQVLVGSAALLLAGQALAAEETAAAFVARLYETGEAPLVVFAPALRAILAGYDSRRRAAVTRLMLYWIFGSEAVSDLSIITLNMSGPDQGALLVRFSSQTFAVARRFELVRRGDEWLIEDVFLSPEHVGLTEQLTSPGSVEE